MNTTVKRLIPLAAVTVFVAAAAVYATTGTSVTTIETDGAEPATLTRLDASGAPVNTQTTFAQPCSRIDIRNNVAACLAVNTQPDTIATNSTIQIVTPDNDTPVNVPIGGYLSRLRLSPDGKWAAITAFSRGHSYSGGATGVAVDVHIVETATGRVDRPVSRYTENGTPLDSTTNTWGVTWTSDTTFLVTVNDTARGIRLAAGNVNDRTLETVEGADGLFCPSISPDGNTLIARDSAHDDRWVITTLDNPTRRDLLDTEPAPIDDQPIWVDDNTVAYTRLAETENQRPTETGQVVTVDIDTGHVRSVTDAGGSPVAP